MRAMLQLLFLLAGGALALTGLFQNNGWMGGGGGIVFVIGAIMWITAPTKPQNLDGGNRPMHDPTDFVGWRD